MLAWDNFLKKQEEELGKETTDIWLRSLKVVHFDACNLYLEAKDSIQSLWFEEHIRPKIRGKFLNNNHHSIKIHLTVAEESVYTPPKKIKKTPPPISSQHFHSDHLDPLATLDNFISNPANQIPLQILKEFSLDPSASFNPIYLYGAQGVGKSHLLMGIAQIFKAKGAQVLYVRSETFTEHFVSAIRNGNMREFRQAYRNADILLIDEVHEFARRSSSQEEFFHTFNALHTSRRPIILAGLKHPGALEDIEPRLISRFEWGISLHIEKLSPAELGQLLKRRLQALEMTLDDEIQTFLIDHFKSGPLSLIRALEALILRSDIPSPPLEKVEFILKDLLALELQNALNPTKIIHSVANYYAITSEDILGRSQTQECALPRQIAMFLCRQELKIPFQKIGKLFTRDHSTVMTSIKAIQKRIDSQEKEILEVLAQIKLD